MRRYTSIEITRLFKKEGISLFTLADFGRFFKIDNQNTLYKKIQRLEERGIIEKLIKGKYLFVFNQPNEFTVANFLYPPSYISLESALSFYGIITGFPYQITSVTVKKTKSFIAGEKEYIYTQINQGLFWGYEKKEDFLIADKEKAFLDFLYLSFKGLRKIDFGEFDLSPLNRKRFQDYKKIVKNKSFLKFLKKMKI